MTSVPSSTFNSDQISRTNTWLKTLGTGLLAGILLITGWECYWRSAGFSPVIEDDLGIWAIERLTLQKSKKTVIALLGASRMQLDVNPQLIEERTGAKAVMLAIDGSSPLPVLEDLASDKSFHGFVLCSLLPQWLADSRRGKSRSAKWVRKYHQQKWSSWINTHLSILLQSIFVFRYPGLLPGKLWEKFLDGESPKPPYAPLRKDRYRQADYSKTDIDRLRKARIKRQQEIVDRAKPLSQQEFTERIRKIETMVQQIRSRGGQVIFLRLPSSGEIRDLEEKTWPRSKYWDHFATHVSAPAYHFADFPELSRFDCPDDSHLDYQDAKTFTYALVDILSLR